MLLFEEIESLLSILGKSGFLVFIEPEMVSLIFGRKGFILVTVLMDSLLRGLKGFIFATLSLASLMIFRENRFIVVAVSLGGIVIPH